MNRNTYIRENSFGNKQRGMSETRRIRRSELGIMNQTGVAKTHTDREEIKYNYPFTTSEIYVNNTMKEKPKPKSKLDIRFEEIQSSLDKKEPLFLDGMNIEKTNYLNSFLEDFFTHYNKICNTVNKEGVPVCGKNRRRSIEDVYIISKSYVKEVTYKEVYEYTHLNTKLTGFFCPDIQKMVFRKNDRDGGSIHIEKDQFGMIPSTSLLMKMRDYGVKYSFSNELLEKINK